MNRLLTASLLTLLPLVPLQAQDALSLDDCFKKALVRSEDLAIRESDYRLAQDKYSEAFGEIYPKVHYQITQILRDESNSGSSSVNDDDNLDNNNSKFTSSNKRLHEGYFNIRQPIFSGFRDFALVRASKADLKAQGLDSERAKQNLYLSVSEAFYQTLLYRSDLSELGKASKAIRDRVTELRNFINLGKSRQSEIFAAESEVADVEATIEGTRRALAASEELLTFFIGEEARGRKLRDDTGAPIVLALDTYLSKIDERDDVRAARERIASAENNLIAAKGARYPSISAEANYYTFEDPEEEREWEVFLRFDWALFEGFKIDAQIRQQNELLEQSRLRSSEARRVAERDLRIAHAELVSSVAETEKLKELLSTSERSYDAQRQDYERGVVTNLDVLQALRRVRDAKRRYEAGRIICKLRLVEVEIAAGEAKS